MAKKNQRYCVVIADTVVGQRRREIRPQKQRCGRGRLQAKFVQHLQGKRRGPEEREKKNSSTMRWKELEARKLSVGWRSQSSALALRISRVRDRMGKK